MPLLQIASHGCDKVHFFWTDRMVCDVDHRPKPSQSMMLSVCFFLTGAKREYNPVVFGALVAPARVVDNSRGW